MRFENKVAQLRIQKHDGRETETFLSDVIRMAEGEELEYLLGEVLFCGTKVDLSLRPMIPRKETEHWVAIAIAKEKGVRSMKQEEARENPEDFRVLDLFAGSGNVGLAFLKNIKECTVDFIEYDPALKKQIEISIEKNNIDISRANVMTGDTLEPLSRQDLHKYDVITAVPPYVPPQMKDEVMKELSAEVPLSFFDKEDGYYYHKQVLSHAKDFLKTGGTLYLEFDITQREKIEQLAQENGWTNYSFLRDPYDHEFVIKLVK
ncbi:MAG: RsmD family RNA methyltransferase [Candidatus Paceibacterota bacterium]